LDVCILGNITLEIPLRLTLEVEQNALMTFKIRHKYRTTDIKDSISFTITCKVLCIQKWETKRQEEIRKGDKIKFSE